MKHARAIILAAMVLLTVSCATVQCGVAGGKAAVALAGDAVTSAGAGVVRIWRHCNPAYNKSGDWNVWQKLTYWVGPGH